MPELFFPGSIDFVKKRAKQLQHAFPGLSLAAAQEATSCALGFNGWFDCSSRMRALAGSVCPVDEEITAARRLTRRYQQINALVDVLGLPASEVEIFVRVWNLTSASAPFLLHDVPIPFEASMAQLNAMQALSHGTRPGEYEDETPVLVAEGIISGPFGRKQSTFLQLSVPRLLQMPFYLRGNASVFHEDDTAGLVALAFPEVFDQSARDAGLNFMEQFEPWLFEWHTGHPPLGFSGMTLKEMVNCATLQPSGWFAISARWPSNENPLGETISLPSLRGADFVRFIENKGVLKNLRVSWLTPKSRRDVRTVGDRDTLLQREETPVFYTDSEVTMGSPLYSTPFKHGPMRAMEFDETVEGAGMPLDEELQWEYADS